MQANLALVEWVQQFRTPHLDAFFELLNFFDTKTFYGIVVLLLWFGKNYRVGLRLFSLFFLSDIALGFFKNFFQMPRPFHLLPELGIISVPGYGFPSGAATTSTLVGGLLLIHAKGPWKWFVAPLFVFLVSLSRVYLGVHFVTDVLGGWILGLLLLAFAYYVLPRIEKQLRKGSRLSLFLLSQVIPSMLFLACRSLPLYVVGVGLLIGLYCQEKLRLLPPEPRNLKENILRGGVGTLTGLLIFFLSEYLSHKVPSHRVFLLFFTGAAISLGGGALCYSLPKKRRYF